jgi:hypothetical protein
MNTSLGMDFVVFILYENSLPSHMHGTRGYAHAVPPSFVDNLAAIDLDRSTSTLLNNGSTRHRLTYPSCSHANDSLLCETRNIPWNKKKYAQSSSFRTIFPVTPMPACTKPGSLKWQRSTGTLPFIAFSDIVISHLIVPNSYKKDNDRQKKFHFS